MYRLIGDSFVIPDRRVRLEPRDEPRESDCVPVPSKPSETDPLTLLTRVRFNRFNRFTPRRWIPDPDRSRRVDSSSPTAASQVYIRAPVPIRYRLHSDGSSAGTCGAASDVLTFSPRRCLRNIYGRSPRRQPFVGGKAR